MCEDLIKLPRSIILSILNSYGFKFSKPVAKLLSDDGLMRFIDLRESHIFVPKGKAAMAKLIKEKSGGKIIMPKSCNKEQLYQVIQLLHKGKTLIKEEVLHKQLKLLKEVQPESQPEQPLSPISEGANAGDDIDIEIEEKHHSPQVKPIKKEQPKASPIKKAKLKIDRSKLEKEKPIISQFSPPTVPKISRPKSCLLYTSPSPRDRQKSRMPSSA